MHLGSETLGLIGIHYPYYSFMLGYPDVLDPYSCARGTVWNGSAKSTSMLCPGRVTLGGFPLPYQPCINGDCTRLA